MPLMIKPFFRHCRDIVSRDNAAINLLMPTFRHDVSPASRVLPLVHWYVNMLLATVWWCRMVMMIMIIHICVRWLACPTNV